MTDVAALPHPAVNSVPPTAEQAAALERTWRDPPGLIGWFSAINHKTIGKRFIVTAFGFFVAGGMLAALMRLQLARPENRLIGPDLYNQLFTMHGTTMMFLFAVPVMQAVSVYLVPLMIGSRSVAFPRMNAFAYWIFLFGGVMLYVAFLLNIGPDAGWFAYPPLAGPDYSPGKRIDFWAQLITFTELSALLEAVILVTTVFKLRAPGMTLNRMPLFVWANAGHGLHGDVRDAGGDAGEHRAHQRPARRHATSTTRPKAAIRCSGSTCSGSSAIPRSTSSSFPGWASCPRSSRPSARRPDLSAIPRWCSRSSRPPSSAFGLWVHHMFATDLPDLGKSFFTAASLMIAIPSAVQIFCWIATLWTGRLNLKTPMLFVLGFFFIFVLGGLTGVMLASVPLDLQVHDTYFVVAHLHYVLIGGAVFPLFGAFYYWYPEIHRPDDERASRALELLALLRRIQHHVLPDAPARPARHAPARLHLPGRDGLGAAQCRRHVRRAA